MKWSWGEPEQCTFDGLKLQFTSTPILHFADNDLLYHVEADSLDVATGAVLSQQLPDDNKWHPVVFYLKSLTLGEKNYEIHNKEILVVIHALEEWDHFLKGTKHCIKIWTDHKNLEYFQTAKKLNHHQACWSLYLLHFNFKLCHDPGTAMGKSDALSHHLDHGSGLEDNSDVTLLHPELFIVHALERLTLLREECGII